ncbi:hypothetical protein DV702_15285 [Sporosarcina sp. PTS2304]|uniref:hypothetical protein n=1 Tax=Sporosarcina sp. PTS2304 TaxID=2283194 RepID=UPI000E0DE3DA|nr:hypothetical protein [Sporosarcina sp. PTS2304]AXI00953.1 hypothetical protein DV702_15285 [Sporosarcina sp. PTS2304]
MRRTLELFIMFFTLLLASCGGPFTSTTSMLTVIEKGHSSDYKEFWIKAYDPSNHNKGEAFRIVVQEEMVWNLIEEDREYFSSYAKEGDKPWILEKTEHSAVERE